MPQRALLLSPRSTPEIPSRARIPSPTDPGRRLTFGRLAFLCVALTCFVSAVVTPRHGGYPHGSEAVEISRKPGLLAPSHPVTSPIPAVPEAKTGAATAAVGAASAAESAAETRPVHKYQVCNGLGNQLIAHVGNIAYAIRNKQDVQILDAYIINGVQSKRNKRGHLKNVKAKNSRYVRLRDVFDVDHLVGVIESYGVKATVEPYDLSRDGSLPCDWKGGEGDTHVFVKVFQAFRPGGAIRDVVGVVQDATRGEGVCVHHRTGKDWTGHCAAWEAIPDGVWRKNCDLPADQKLEEAIYARLLPQPGDAQRRSTVFYVGDGLPPEALQAFGFNVVSRRSILTDAWGVPQEGGAVLTHGIDMTVEDIKPILTDPNVACPHETRDLCAVVDFFTCASLPHFVGNSVSTWSALQIAHRPGDATWYNSRSLPLAEMFDVYPITIAYTYTEASSKVGQLLLKASILSARLHNPASEIHVLYLGTDDAAFRAWLQGERVIVHDQDPLWMDDIKSMFEHGDAKKSHLFLHLGNYVGTWQRIDIPLYINAEYVLLLDCDTIVMAPFSYKDFGLEMTGSIAFSAEVNEASTEPWNAGVALLNVPHLRETYHDFLAFIRTHRENQPYPVTMKDGSIIDAPSDQGAYLTFYQESKKFLKITFNVKPYYKGVELAASTVMHFHGAKPHDYMGQWMGKDCSPAVKFLCDGTKEFPLLCPSLKYFAVSIMAHEHELLEEYCKASFEDNADHAAMCIRFLQRVAKMDVEYLSFGDACKKLLVNTMRTGWGKDATASTASQGSHL
eukprot:TRINITY_DN1923_c0_g4_i1.p1 TRINITY_DN1923_c0_g4~~TRINITY_DN1923_c0_g4_i1.p1  ORF type:complete len:788 (+),score=186.17 TRINITY_DN1923_c0_g4_i1:51-2414(+)